MWDLRGLGRVGAHCASSSNPDANHEWMGVLLILGDRERPSARMIQACQDFRTDVFLPRWPGRTRDTGHGRAPGVPGAQTSCPGPFAAELIVDGVLTDQPTEDDMPLTNADVEKIWEHRINKVDKTSGSSPDMQAETFQAYQHHYALATLRGSNTANDKLDALLAAAEGLDTAAVLERIDGHHADVLARLEASQERDAAILAAVEQVDSGEVTAAEALRQLAALIQAEIPDADA